MGKVILVGNPDTYSRAFIDKIAAQGIEVVVVDKVGNDLPERKETFPKILLEETSLAERVYSPEDYENRRGRRAKARVEKKRQKQFRHLNK